MSVPVGQERVEFNAHRVFAPQTIVHQAEKNQLQLQEFSFVKNNNLKISTNINKDMEQLALEKYSLGIFKFEKTMQEG